MSIERFRQILTELTDQELVHHLADVRGVVEARHLDLLAARDHARRLLKASKPEAPDFAARDSALRSAEAHLYEFIFMCERINYKPEAWKLLNPGPKHT